MNKKLELEPVGAKLIIKIEEISDKSKGGLFLPTAEVNRRQDSLTEGILIAKGPNAFDFIADKERHPQVGDQVSFVKYSGIGKKIEEQEYRILNDEDLYAYKRQQVKLENKNGRKSKKSK